jgi:enoyl-CoA hydratase/carnithine racemase
MSEENPVLLERADGVARVTLNRPAQRNAVDLPTCIALRGIFEQLDGDDAVRAVLIAGAGPLFCAGADLKERDGRDMEWVRRRRLAAFATYDAIERCSKPVVALVHGAAIGSGGEIALAADFVIAEEDAYFQFPEPKWGTVGATQRLQRAIGLRSAKELLLTGRKLDAQEAQMRGLVARLAPKGGLEAAGHKAAGAIVAAPALAIRLTKQAMDLGSRTDLANGIRIELAAIDHNLSTDEWRSGQDKFLKQNKSDH